MFENPIGEDSFEPLLLQVNCAKDRLDHLHGLYRGLITEWQHAEVQSDRTTIIACSVLIGLPVFAVDHQSDGRILLLLLVPAELLLACVALLFIHQSSQHSRLLAKMIVRIQQICGYYTAGLLLTDRGLESFDRKPFAETSIMPWAGQKWGSSTWLQRDIARSAAVLCCAALASLWLVVW